MRRRWQVVGFWGVLCSSALADEGVKTFTWMPPKVAKHLFSPKLDLMDTERDEYATNLAILSSNTITQGKASETAIEAARRMLGLALQLSPRNKRAVVTNFQLSKGILPALSECIYEPKAFARLLLTRGQLLDKTDNAENKQLAGYFIQLAAELDPKNEEAVYSSEMLRLDQSAPDWSALTGGEAGR
jgi:hypothetical protein